MGSTLKEDINAGIPQLALESVEALKVEPLEEIQTYKLVFLPNSIGHEKLHLYKGFCKECKYLDMECDLNLKGSKYNKCFTQK